MNLFPRKKPAAQISTIPFRTITLKTTRFRMWDFDTNSSVCNICGKKDQIFAGLPDELRLTLPIPFGVLDAVSEKVFYISGDLDFNCVNGVAHIVKGEATKRRWLVSMYQSPKDGLHEIAETLEKALAAFLPQFYEEIQKQGRTTTERLGQVVERKQLHG